MKNYEDDFIDRHVIMLLLIIVADIILTIYVTVESIKTISEPSFSRILLCVVESVATFVGGFLALAFTVCMACLLCCVFILLLQGQYAFFCLLVSCFSSQNAGSTFKYKKSDEYGINTLTQGDLFLRKLNILISSLFLCAMFVWHIIVYIGQ